MAKASTVEVNEDGIPQGYRRAFLKCRALGHSWIHSTDVLQHDTKAWVRGLSSLCDVCGTVRTRWMTGTGSKEGMRYTYPDGYTMKRSDGQSGTLPRPAPKPVTWRREFVSHLNFPASSAPIKR